MGCVVEETDTGGKLSLHFEAVCEGEYAGYIKVHRAQRKLRGQRVWSVDNVYVVPERRRSRVATRLYEAAAQGVCKRRSRLASTGRNPRAHSEDFWQKQVRKGRATRIKRRGDADAYVLECEHATDLGRARERRSDGGMAALATLGAASVALLVLASRRW